MEKLTLQNPITINGKKVKTLTYDTDAITVGMFADAEARKLRATSNKGGGSAGACELDYSLHAYLAMMKPVAICPARFVSAAGKPSARIFCSVAGSASASARQSVRMAGEASVRLK